MSDMDDLFPGGTVKEEMKKKPARKTETTETGRKPTDLFHQLQYIQQNLKVGKNNTNHQLNAAMRDDSFPYRTLEEIYQELKPILADVDCVMTTTCKPILLGQCIFAQATVTLENARGERRETTASAMMNLTCGTYKYPAQETAACETMAKKSAIGAMFLLDNTTKEKQADMVTTEMSALTQPGHTAAGSVRTAAPAATAAAPAPAAVKAPAPAKAVPAPVAAAPAKTAATPSPAPAPATPRSVPTPAKADSAIVRTPAAEAEQKTSENWKKPELIKGSTTWQKLGRNTSCKFIGSRKKLIADIRSRYEMDDATAEEFANCFWNEAMEKAA